MTGQTALNAVDISLSLTGVTTTPGVQKISFEIQMIRNPNILTASAFVDGSTVDVPPYVEIQT
ncbi:MAG: hypothetical protein QF535_03690 [Anaerolineales bacterium]|jgi:hypothetical protein|nr:hypothetical protein [Anaerolineales bacterium]